MNKAVTVKSIFYIEITETLSRVIKVNANDEQSALLNVQALYQNKEVVLGSEDYQSTEFEVVE
ncbi:DpnD/PcfM family protein [Psychrobacter sp. GP33]|uniref:DpnD/PcfM family protein n=1 Tax=Psychrobacter sp. GP33 TaxID=2758709 RepID=UPI0015F8FC7B|nr:DpnD/PcfM family protein [Psychrobacter sp. GP33]